MPRTKRTRSRTPPNNNPIPLARRDKITKRRRKGVEDYPALTLKETKTEMRDFPSHTPPPPTIPSEESSGSDLEIISAAKPLTTPGKRRIVETKPTIPAKKNESPRTRRVVISDPPAPAKEKTTSTAPAPAPKTKVSSTSISPQDVKADQRVVSAERPPPVSSAPSQAAPQQTQTPATNVPPPKKADSNAPPPLRLSTLNQRRSGSVPADIQPEDIDEDEDDDDLDDATSEEEKRPWDVGAVVWMSGTLDRPLLRENGEPLAPCFDGPCRPTFVQGCVDTGSALHIWDRQYNQFVSEVLVSTIAIEANPITTTSIRFFDEERDQWIYIGECFQAAKLKISVEEFRKQVAEEEARLEDAKQDDLAVADRKTEEVRKNLETMSLRVKVSSPYFSFDVFYRSSALIRPLGCCQRVYGVKRMPGLVAYHKSIKELYNVEVNFTWLLIRRGYQEQPVPDRSVWNKLMTAVNITLGQLGDVGFVTALEGGEMLQRKAISARVPRHKLLKRKVSSENNWSAFGPPALRLKSAEIPFRFDNSEKRGWDYWCMITGYRAPQKRKDPLWGAKVERSGRKWID